MKLHQAWLDIDMLNDIDMLELGCLNVLIYRYVMELAAKV